MGGLFFLIQHWLKPISLSNVMIFFPSYLIMFLMFFNAKFMRIFHLVSLCNYLKTSISILNYIGTQSNPFCTPFQIFFSLSLLLAFQSYWLTIVFSSFCFIKLDTQEHYQTFLFSIADNFWLSVLVTSRLRLFSIPD